MSAVVDGLQGVLCLIDDMLIFGRGKAECDERLFAALNEVQNVRVTLNAEKCKFWFDQVGHVISKNVVTFDPAKTAAIKEIKAPINLIELCKFVDTVNQLGKFSPHLAELSSPLR